MRSFARPDCNLMQHGEGAVGAASLTNLEDECPSCHRQILGTAPYRDAPLRYSRDSLDRVQSRIDHRTISPEGAVRSPAITKRRVSYGRSS